MVVPKLVLPLSLCQEALATSDILDAAPKTDCSYAQLFFGKKRGYMSATAFSN